MLDIGSIEPREVAFREWTAGREITALCTNAGSQILPFQGWRTFKEAFAPELVELAIKETAGPVDRILDPFGGSGTTALAAQFLGVKPTTIEVNPFLADLIEAKIARYDLEQVAREFAGVIERAQNYSGDFSKAFASAPPTLIEPGVDDRYIFSRAVAARLHAYRSAIEKVRNANARRLFRVHLAAISVPVSNVVVSGKGRRYRGNWKNRAETPSVDRRFREGVLNALFDLRRYEDRRCKEYEILRGDSRILIDQIEPIDLAVFSPPYPNSFDYTDVYNVELWSGWYLRNSRDNRALREATLRSHVQIHRDMTASNSSSPTLRKALRKLDKVRAQLWNRHIPEMVEAYFDDMRRILNVLHGKLRFRGRAYMVVGDSRYAGVNIPVSRILGEEAPQIGFKMVRSEPFRSMRSSPQQGGRRELLETLVVLER